MCFFVVVFFVFFACFFFFFFFFFFCFVFLLLFFVCLFFVVFYFCCFFFVFFFSQKMEIVASNMLFLAMQTYFVQGNSAALHKYSDADVVKMLKYLIDKIIVEFGGRIIGIPTIPTKWLFPDLYLISLSQPSQSF